MKHQIRVQILREGAVLPSYGSALAAGADLCACLPEAVTKTLKEGLSHFERKMQG